MKKTITLITVVLIAASVMAQNAVSVFDQATGNLGSRDVTALVCPEGSLYGQLPDGVNAWIGQNGYVFYDNLMTAPGAPVKTITFWMLKNPADPVNLVIIFRANSGGIPGAVIASHNVSLTGVPTGEFWQSWEAFTYTFELPTAITLAAGDWVGIQALPDSYGHHYWLTSDDGDMANYLFPDNGNYGFDLAFCLGGANNVPVAPWALAIGIALIAVTVVIRLRRF